MKEIIIFYSYIELRKIIDGDLLYMISLFWVLVLFSGVWVIYLYVFLW